jgi:biopolymer transport protein ExbD
MIPLIDVMLVILIIFMIITPFFITSHIRVNLPKSSSSPDTITSNTSKDIIKVTITSDEKIYVNSKKVNDLEKELILQLSRVNEKTVLVESDKNVPIQSVVNVLDTAKKLGAERVGISVVVSK